MISSESVPIEENGGNAVSVDVRWLLPLLVLTSVCVFAFAFVFNVFAGVAFELVLKPTVRRFVASKFRSPVTTRS
jgi:hypothetical protein